jgi:hypothetical protein
LEKENTGKTLEHTDAIPDSSQPEDLRRRSFLKKNAPSPVSNPFAKSMKPDLSAVESER